MNWRTKLRVLFGKEKLDAEMSEEMRTHLELQASENIARGMDPDAARHAAQRSFGGVEQIKELARDERGWVWLEQAAQDLRFAARSLRKTPGFAVVAILTLALGIATATTMFTLYSAELLRPMPYLADEGSLLRIRSYQIKDPGDDFDVSLPNFRDLRGQAQSLSSTLAVWNRTFVVGGDERPERAAGAALTADGFQTLGVQPLLGRLFRPDDGKPGVPEVVLLSHALWQRAYGGRPDIVGQVINVNQQPATVVGVMPEGFGFPVNSGLWQPLRDDAGLTEDQRVRRGHSFYARMAPGATLRRVQAELDTIAERLERDHPEANTGLRFRAFFLHDEATRFDKPMLQLLLGAALVVLLIACVNMANLLLARATTRGHEIALRVALGAARGRIVRQVLVESLLLGAIGGGASVALAKWEKDLLLTLAPFDPPYWLRFDLDWRVLGFAIVVTVGTSLFFGLFPALQCSKADVARDLKSGGRASTGARGTLRLRSALVIGQTALAFVLLVAGGLMTRSFVHLARADLGFQPGGLLTFRTGLPDSVGKSPQKTLDFYETIEAQLRATPGVDAAGFVSFAPLKTNSRSDAIVIEGRPTPKPDERQFAFVRSASPGVLDALRIPLRRGRFFDATDRAGQPLVAVVDEAFVKRYFPDEDPLGRRFAFDQPTSRQAAPRWFTIIGVMAQAKQHATARNPEPNIWTAMSQGPDNFMDAVVRVQGDPIAFTQACQEAVRAARADTPLFALAPMTKVARDAIGWERLFGGVFGSFAVIALFLAAIGIYGVMAYGVAQRTREIGVRVALGARPGTIVGLVLRQGGKVIALGLVLGLLGAWFAAARMSGVLHGIVAHDISTFVGVPLLLGAVALLACCLPARRAAKVDPMIALRSE